jgi:hypothetical protein
MAVQSNEVHVASLIYDFLSKKDVSLAQMFQKKTHAVSFLNFLYDIYCRHPDVETKHFYHNQFPVCQNFQKTRDIM